MKKKFILIGHKKRQGKDTFAKMLKEHLGDAEILSYADPMREILAEYRGMSVDEFKAMYNDDEAERDMVKIFGNGKMIEYFGKYVWRDVLLRRAEKLNVEYIIVPDFRFLREIIDDAITIKVYNYRVESLDNHQSETELDSFGFDILIKNDEGFFELEEKASSLAEHIEEHEGLEDISGLA